LGNVSEIFIFKKYILIILKYFKGNNYSNWGRATDWIGSIDYNARAIAKNVDWRGLSRWNDCLSHRRASLGSSSNELKEIWSNNCINVETTMMWKNMKKKSWQLIIKKKICSDLREFQT
jgi:hypothetical protein